MKHLSVDEMINFVSFDKLDGEALAAASKASAHILKCGACRKKITAYQTVYDELVRIGRKNEFDATVKKKTAVSDEQKQIEESM